ncbi:MAG TPA: DUF4129 domain-containing protein [Polyangiales bacterium]
MKSEPTSPLEVLNEAIELTRTTPLKHNLVAAIPALCLCWLVAFVYYLEQVEGVRALRPVCALALTAAWCARGVVLSRHAGRQVDRRLAHLPPAARHSALDTRVRVALVLGAELWLWLWLLVVALRIDPWLCTLAAPLFALRGALAPSWLAAADASQAESARSAALYAIQASQRQRLTGIALELALLLSALALFLNLGALLVAGISLAQDLLGLRLAFVRAFISPRNHFALLGLLSLSLSAFDPLRAAVAAVLYAEQRLAREALEVRALVEVAIAPRNVARVVGLSFVLALALPASAQAQIFPATDAHSLYEDECDPVCREVRRRDDAVQVRLVTILDASEFQDFALEGAELPELERPSLERWLERLGRWLSGAPEKVPERGEDLSRVTPLHVPLPLLLSGLGLLLLALGSLAFWHAQRRLTSRRVSRVPAEPATPTIPDMIPDTSLRGALRHVYLQTLERLAQRGLLHLSRANTNGDYLRMLQSARLRSQLARLTALFERAQYGRATPSESELSEARELGRTLALDEAEA